MIFFKTDILGAIYALGIFIAIYGWGLLVNRLTNYQNRNPVINLTLGVGVIIFFGGIFNVLHIAYGWIFDILLLIGILITIRSQRFHCNLPRNKNEWFHWTIIGFVIFLIMFFTIDTQLSPNVYNHHDDFEKYFAHPLRMLQTGTLFGSPLSAIGAETMGGQAVLHAILLNHVPLSYINGVDAVFGLFMCLLLSASMWSRKANFIPITFISLLMVFFINNQYVNITACYVPVAMMMTVTLLSCDMKNVSKIESDCLPPPIMIGLIYAALVALKSNLILFPILHISFYVIALKIYRANFHHLARWSIMTVGFTLLFLLPWILLHYPHYVRSFSQIHHSSFLPHLEFSQGFSVWQVLTHGSSFVRYTALSVAIIFFVCVSVLLKRNENTLVSSNYCAGLIASGATAITSYFLIILLGPFLNGYETNLRYAIPYLLASAPVTFAFTCCLVIRNNCLRNRLVLTALLLVGILVLVSFSGSLGMRLRRGYDGGSIHVYLSSMNRSFLAYTDEVLNGDTKLRINTAQERVPAGSSIVAWITTPFHLNYRRNIIYDADPAGLANPWAYVPDSEYFMLEYRGFAVRSYEHYQRYMNHAGKHERHLAKSDAEFYRLFYGLRGKSKEIYDDGRIVVFKKR